MKRWLLVLFSSLLLLCSYACITPEYEITYDLDGGTFSDVVNTFYSSDSVMLPIPKKDNYKFMGWYEGDELVYVLSNKNYNLVAKWERVSCSIVYNLNNGTYDGVLQEVVTVNEYIELPTVNKKDCVFAGWYTTHNFKRGTFVEGMTCVDDYTLYARFWGLSDTVIYDYGQYIYADKVQCGTDFYTSFYHFIMSKDGGEEKLKECNINNSTEFVAYCYTWSHGDRSDLYAVGDNFGSYFLTKDTDGVIENQSVDTFIGYCYQNNMFCDLIKHLIKFFAYWRTDEGYTTPDNHGNDFFHDTWASLVDTAKFFYFSGDTLNNKYSWFNSQRVKDALDNVPGVVKNGRRSETSDTTIVLYIPILDGYTFDGWYKDEKCSTKITYVEFPTYQNYVFGKFIKVED